MTPLSCLWEHIVEAFRRPSRLRKPYFHVVPLLLPSMAALAGATFASPAAGVASVIAGALLGVVAARAGRRVGVLTLALLLFSVGCWRGAGWRAQSESAARLCAAGACRISVMPLVPAVDQGQGTASFRARIVVAEPLSGETPFREAPGLLVDVLAFSRDIQKVVPGETLDATGRFSLPARALNPGEFDLRKHLRSERTFLRFECSRLEVPPGRPHGLDGAYACFLGKVRSYVEGAIRSCLPAREASVLEAVLLGDRSGIPYDMSLDFRRSGFYRFATVAGFHIDVVFGLARALLLRSTRKPRVATAAATSVAFVYAGLSGWTPGAIRAFTCALMRAIAPEARSRYYSLAGLAAAGLAAAWLIPFPLTDVGLQLSFAGALGSFLAGRCVPLVKPRFPAAPAGLLRIAGIFLLLFPITASSFQDVSLAGFPAGGLWAASVTLLIPASLLTVLLPGAGAWAGWFPCLLIRGIQQAASWVSSIPGSSVAVPAPGTMEVVAYYLLILVFMAGVEDRLQPKAGFDPGPGTSRPPARWRAAATAACSAALLAGASIRVHPPWLEVTFISVGQADCALVRYGGASMLVDAGTAAACQGSVVPYLTRLGLSRVDLCALSHLHDDHAGGLAGLCDALRVDAVLTGDGTAAEAGVLVEAPGQAAGRPPPRVLEAGPGDSFRLGGLNVVSVSLPGAMPAADQANDQSLVLIVSGPAGFSVEFWGDAPSGPVAGILAAHRDDLAGGGVFRVAKVPHHGSRDSLCAGFYERLSPGLAVISVGPNVYGHPSSQVIQEAAGQGARLLRTDTSGAVTVRWIFGRAWVTSYAGE